MKKILFIPIMLIAFISAFGQTDQIEYLEAKRLYNNGQYLSAKAAFGALQQSDVFGKQASFYFGLCAYQLGDYKVSKSLFRGLLIQFPSWDQYNEVLYWLALSNFETQDLNEGLKYASQLTERTYDSSAERGMVNIYCGKLEGEALKALFDENPDNKFVAELYTRRLLEVGGAERDITTINQLVEKWGFNLNELDMLQLPELKREVYNMAVLLPFLFEGLENTDKISQNSLVMDMYQGMLLAAEDLKAEGKPVNLFPYDTYKSGTKTQEILKKSGFESMDLILGAIYEEPSQVVREYSQANQVNYFNPISSFSKMLDDSPYSFLVKPSYETMATKLGALAANEAGNKNAMIFYEKTERDSVFAKNFRTQIEADSANIILFQAITKENMNLILDTLVAQYDNYLFKSEADSISKIRGRFVKDRKVRRAELKRMEMDSTFNLPVSYNDDGEPIVYYEKLFHMKPDSIGIILAATRSNLFANNLISAVETRGDSTLLYGYGDWLDFTMLSYNQLDRLDVALCSPEFIDKEQATYIDLEKRFIAKYKTQPSINHLRGYEVVYYTGRMMHQYGKYFQRGMRTDTFKSARVMEGFRYGAANDNQVVPVVRFNKAKLEVVNQDSYEY